MQCLAPRSWSSTVKSSPGPMEIQCLSMGVLVAQRPSWTGETPPCGSHLSPFLSQPCEDGERARVPGRLVLSEPQTLHCLAGNQRPGRDNRAIIMVNRLLLG